MCDNSSGGCFYQATCICQPPDRWNTVVGFVCLYIWPSVKTSSSWASLKTGRILYSRSVVLSVDSLSEFCYNLELLVLLGSDRVVQGGEGTSNALKIRWKWHVWQWVTCTPYHWWSVVCNYSDDVWSVVCNYSDDVLLFLLLWNIFFIIPF